MRGCLVIHGFTGSPFEVGPLVTHLKKQGYHTMCPTLPGHGEQPDPVMGEVTWEDWVRGAERALQELRESCEQVSIIGFSMGALIAAYLANRYPIEHLVLLSSSVFVFNKKQMVKDFTHAVRLYIAEKATLEEYQRYRTRVQKTPLRAVTQFFRLVRNLKPEFNRIYVPTLIVHGALDDLIDPRSSTFVYRAIPTPHKQLHTLSQSKHIVCRGCEREKLFQTVDAFLQQGHQNRVDGQKWVQDQQGMREST